MPVVIQPKSEIHDKIRLIRISAVFLVQPELFFKNSARKSRQYVVLLY